MNYPLRRHSFSIIVVALLLVALTPPLKAVTNVEAPQSQGSFSDGFESRDFSAWSGVALTSGDTATVGASNPYAGSYSALFQTSGVVSGNRRSSVYENVDPSIDIYARGYFQITNGLPLDDNGDRFGLIAFLVGVTTLASFRVYRAGGVDKFNIIGYNGTGNYPSQSTDNIHPAQGRWYCVEFYARIHGTQGEYCAWIDGTEQLSITGVNSAVLGNITAVFWGIPFSIDVQHPVSVFGDCAEINDVYIGPLNEAFGVVGSTSVNPAITNFYWLFGNQSISYTALSPSDIQSITDIDRFESLVLWTKQASYNVTALKQYATTHIVIADMKEFCTVLYPTLNASLQTVQTSTVTYAIDWGSFHAGDLVEMRNETGNTDRLTTVLSSSLISFGNVTTIARFGTSRIAFFHMNGSQAESGFYVMDLDATTPDTAKTGIWHVFPAVKMVKDFPTGQYAVWMANGQQWWNLTWVYSRVDTLVDGNPDAARKQVIGYSVQGRAIPAIFIGNGTKNAIIDGSIHGNEKTGTFACLRLTELLINYYKTDPIWRSRLTEFKVIIVPVLNPDGFVNNTRENANNMDLNSQFPPDGTTTEPEAWALRWLMGNYTPAVYVNMHEGYYWYPLGMLYGNYETGAGKSATIEAMQYANETFAALNHYGWFTESGSNVWIGNFKAIYQGSKLGMAVAYASYQYHASCMLLETFVWSPTWGARECLWGLDCYCASSLGFLAKHSQVDSSVDIANFDTLFAKNPDVRMIYPSDNSSKPLNCSAALVSDWTASAFVFTKLGSVREGYDTDPRFVDQKTGNAVGSSGTGIITFGGPIVNPLVKYAGSTNTSSMDKAPVRFYDESGTFYFIYQNGSKIPGASLPINVINNNQDMLLIEIYKDASGRYIMLCYGFGWKGTYAAGKYFDTVIYPTIDSHTESWIIVKWDDTNNNGLVNTPGDGDTYTIIAKGN